MNRAPEEGAPGGRASEPVTWSSTANSGLTTDLDFQRVRVGLYLRVLFLIHIVFLVVSAVQFALGLEVPGADTPTLREQIIEWLATAGLGAAWWVVSRGPVRREVLSALDAGVPPLLGLLYMSLVAGLGVPEPGQLILILVSLTLVLRAALVPSPVGRTVAVGLLGVAIAVTGAVVLDTRSAPMLFLWLGVMGGAFVAVTAVTSSVIYGLRKEVRAATRLGQYELTRKIGEGGMGTVYEANHLLLRRPTAVKVLPTEKAGEEAIARFEHEVRQTSRLEHPNTVSIFDYGRTPDGQFYYAMELLRGFDLEQLVRRFGPLGEGRVVYLLRQAAFALAEAHDMGLVHRDVKPSNIMVCDRGGVADTVKLLDFGLVKPILSTSTDDVARTLAVTQPATVVGTPHYLAPEAIRQGKIGPAVDVYALGAVGFFLLTGREVFPGSSAIEILSMHLTAEPPDLSRVVGRPVDTGLASLLSTCLAKSPDERHATGRELGDALAAIRLGGWSQDDARSWWAEHGDQPGRREDVAAMTSETERTQLAVDVRSRAGR